MLQQFTLGNWASFKSPMTLSLEASSDTEHEESNVINVCEKRLLKSAVIYGANASGKSNLLSAMQFVRSFILSSSKEGQVEEGIATDPFRLCSNYEEKPCHFEIIFIQAGTRFRYGFEVDGQRVHSEWLFSSSSSREAELFKRENQEITPNPERFKEGKGLAEKTRPNALFLSVVAQFNGEISASLIKWFLDFRFILATRNPRLSFTVERLPDASFAARVLDMSKIADLGIEGLIPKTSYFTEDDLAALKLPSPVTRKAFLGKVKEIQLKTQHKKFDSNNQLTGLVEFDLEKDESEGTKKFFSMTGPLIDALETGKVLAADELDARLHPLLSRAIILFFNNTTNKRNAQLIFATHDTNLLNRQLFRRDQIWFTEKDAFGATDLYSLSEFKVRKDASFGRDYIVGKFGAIPFIGDINRISYDAQTVG